MSAMYSMAAGTSAMATQFPMFQLNDAAVKNGSVKIIARSPGGQTKTLNIQQNPNGQYKTDFTPNEAGESKFYVHSNVHSVANKLVKYV